MSGTLRPASSPIRMGWERYSLSVAPSELGNASKDNSSMDATGLGPLGDRFPNTVDLKKHGPALVVAIISVCNPAAIARFVVAIVVDAVYLVFSRTFTYIGKKVLKRRLPSVAHLNTSASVVLPAVDLRVAASLLDVQPNTVSAGFRHSMLGSPIRASLIMQASTATCVPIAKQFALNYSGVSA